MEKQDICDFFKKKNREKKYIKIIQRKISKITNASSTTEHSQINI